MLAQVYTSWVRYSIAVYLGLLMAGTLVGSTHHPTLPDTPSVATELLPQETPPTAHLANVSRDDRLGLCGQPR